MEFFRNRVDAGKLLAKALQEIVDNSAIVLAIPRGGVVVGFQVASAIDMPLDLIIPRKLGAPGNPELAFGAVTEDGTVILDDELVKHLGVSKEYIKEECKTQRSEIERRLKLYRGNLPYPKLQDLQVIIVDDGVATGSTMKAAVLSVRRRKANNVIVAIPVGPSLTVEELEKQADQVVCLHKPEPFYAIGEFYENFDQTTDEEVRNLLRIRRQESTRA